MELRGNKVGLKIRCIEVDTILGAIENEEAKASIEFQVLLFSN